MTSPTASPSAATLAPQERLLRSRILQAITVVAVIDLFLFLPLVYGLIANDASLKPIFGPLHGTGFLIELGLVAYGAINKWWGWWYAAVTLITTGPPGALLGHGKAKREALGS